VKTACNGGGGGAFDGRECGTVDETDVLLQIAVKGHEVSIRNSFWADNLIPGCRKRLEKQPNVFLCRLASGSRSGEKTSHPPSFSLMHKLLLDLKIKSKKIYFNIY
jgi:hypothetical protein